MDALTFQREVLRLEKLMYHVSWTMLGSSEDCADAVQEALMRAWQKRHTLRSPESFKPWLMRILINECKNILRRRKRSSLYPLEEAADIPSAAGDSGVMDVLRTLKPAWRTVIVLHYLEGCSVEEIAQMTGAPAGTVKSRLKYARDKLGVLLHED